MKHNQRQMAFVKGIILGILFLCSIPGIYAQTNSTSVQGPGNCQLMWSYIQAADALNANLSRMDQSLVEASLALGRTGLEGSEAQQILRELTLTDPSIIDCATISTNGTILEIKPEEFQYVKGDNVGYQEQFKKIIASKNPAGFGMIKTLEGFYALLVSDPVFDENGQFIGVTGTLINSTEFFGSILAPRQPKEKAEFWVMGAKDGTVLYDTDKTQIGLKLTDIVFQQFSELQNLGKRVERERAGYGTYEFFDQDHKKTVKKSVYWTTLANRGDEIRLMLTQVLE
jgi:hypothetical protein